MLKPFQVFSVLLGCIKAGKLKAVSHQCDAKTESLQANFPLDNYAHRSIFVSSLYIKNREKGDDQQTITLTTQQHN